jgi:hypothetical protein
MLGRRQAAQAHGNQNASAGTARWTARDRRHLFHIKQQTPPRPAGHHCRGVLTGYSRDAHGLASSLPRGARLSAPTLEVVVVASEGSQGRHVLEVGRPVRRPHELIGPKAAGKPPRARLSMGRAVCDRAWCGVVSSARDETASHLAMISHSAPTRASAVGSPMSCMACLSLGSRSVSADTVRDRIATIRT